jgi:hypothetical protein
MFDDKSDLIGVLLLGLCAVVGGALVWEIVTGNELEYGGPGWLVPILGILFFGGVVYGLFQGFAGRRKSGGSPQWPAPDSGRKSRWDRLRGR